MTSYLEEVFNGYDVDFYEMFDLYCPICNKEKIGIDYTEKERIINRQKIIENYEEIK